jgi:hypothetical protein
LGRCMSGGGAALQGGRRRDQGVAGRATEEGRRLREGGVANPRAGGVGGCRRWLRRRGSAWVASGSARGAHGVPLSFFCTTSSPIIFSKRSASNLNTLVAYVVANSFNYIFLRCACHIFALTNLNIYSAIFSFEDSR